MHSDIQSLLDEAFGAPIVIASTNVLQTLDHSRVYRVLLQNLDRSVIIKESSSLEGLFLAQREARFYEVLAPMLPVGICPTCHLVKDLDGTLVLILEDLPGKTLAPGAPRNSAQVEGYVRALARLFHGSAKLKNLDSQWRDAFGTHPYNYISGRAENYPDLVKRFIDAKGDAHFGNALYVGNQVTLIDWANVALGFSEIDLAHLLALNLPQDTRRELEGKMLNLYAELTNQPLDGVSRRYRLGVLFAVKSAMGMWDFGVPNWATLFDNATNAALK